MTKLKNNHHYKGTVTRIVDGDTIYVETNLGFTVKMDICFRMSGYDSPETYRPKTEEERVRGKAATEYLKHLIEGKTVYVQSDGFGKYRWLGTIYLPESEISVNQMMIDAGHIK